jgi:hypothetical protein
VNRIRRGFVISAVWLLFAAGCDDPELQKQLTQLQNQVSGEPQPAPPAPPPPPPKPVVAPEHVAILEQMVVTAQGLRAPFAAVNPENATKSSFRAWRFDGWRDFIVKHRAEGEGDAAREMGTIEFDALGKFGPFYSLRAAAVGSPINEMQPFQVHYVVDFEFQGEAWRYIGARWSHQTTVGQRQPVDIDSSHNACCEYLFQRPRQTASSSAAPAS